jgi:hypothetical protein
MSCDNSTHYTAIVDLASYSSLELGDYPTARETDVACDQSLKRCRSGPATERSKSKPHIIRDSIQTVPEYVWGDEGPIND